MATLQAKLANKFNKRIKQYNKIFGKGYAYNIYSGIKGVKITKSKREKNNWIGGEQISAKTFTGADAENITKEFEKKLPAPSKLFNKMAKELGTKDQKAIVENIIAKDEVSDRFQDARDKFYDFEKRRDFGTIIATDKKVRTAYDLIYHTGAWDSYTQMLEAIQAAEEALKNYGY